MAVEIMEKDYLSGEDFLNLYRQESYGRGKIRLLALHHIQRGEEVTSVSKMLCITRRSLYKWLGWYKEGGLDKLLSRPIGRGCKKKVKISKEALQQGILDLQESRDGGRIIGYDIISWIEEKYGVKYSIGHIYNLLKSLGLSWITVRSKHPKQDEALQIEFKKNLYKSVKTSS